MMQLRNAQRVIGEQTQELDALRAHTLKRVMTEERSRYAKLMVGILDVLKVQVRHYQRVSLLNLRSPSLRVNTVGLTLSAISCIGQLHNA